MAPPPPAADGFALAALLLLLPLAFAFAEVLNGDFPLIRVNSRRPTRPAPAETTRRADWHNIIGKEEIVERYQFGKNDFIYTTKLSIYCEL